MLAVLHSFLNTLQSVVNFVINTFTSLIDFMLHIPTYVTFISNSINNVLPSILLPFVTVCISVYVVLFIINRR